MMHSMKRHILLVLPLAMLVAGAMAAAVFFIKPPLKDLSFERVPFNAITGWYDDNMQEARPALVKSCSHILALPDNRRISASAIGGTAAEWRGFCDAVLAFEHKGSDSHTGASRFRQLLERHTVAFAVSAGANPEGIFTGYYEALLNGSFTRDETYRVPLYGKPADLVMVDLGAFRPDLKGRRIAGRVEGGRLLPYADRAAIDQGALDKKGKALIWVDSPVDAFFLHIQGSGRVRLQDGTWLRVGYAGQNGHSYYPIGRKLIESGEVARENMSMQAIRRWMAANPDRAGGLMQQNKSYIFFRQLDGTHRGEIMSGPFGSAGVPLTPTRSLAVDRRHLPLHVPVFLSTLHPDPKGVAVPDKPFNRLMVAQDTGGAITGEIRGDVFWGFGEKAAEIAGRMASKGRYWILLPEPLAEKLESADD